jgi:hypothetical protein
MSGLALRISPMKIFIELYPSSTGQLRTFRFLMVVNWKTPMRVYKSGILLVLRFKTSRDGNSASSSPIDSILLCLRFRILRFGSPSCPEILAIELFYAYSSSSLGQFLKGDKFLNLFSATFKILRFG